MTLDTGNKLCDKCKKSISISKCYGCQGSFCSRHLIKHRLDLSEQLDEFNRKQDAFRQDLEKNQFEYSFLTSIYAWERKSMRLIQEIAEKARQDLQEWTDRIRNEMKNSLEQISQQIQASTKADNFTELDLHKWTKQLDELRDLLEKPSTISIVEDNTVTSLIHPIQVVEKPSSHQISSQATKDLSREHFVKVYGSCELSENDSLVTQSSYRAGLSQISGYNHYSSGIHSIEFLIENKGQKNLFIGILSSSHKIISPTFDYSVHGWWNFDHTIINGESKTNGIENETIQSGDRLRLIIDCEQHRIELEHRRTKRLVQIPINLEVCPFPWKIIVRLLSSGDAIRIIS